MPNYTVELILQNSVRGYFIVPTNYYLSQPQIDAINDIFLNPLTGNAYADRDDAILSIIQRPDVVVVVAPEGQLLAGVGEAVEDFLVQACIPQAAVEAFDQSPRHCPRTNGRPWLDAAVCRGRCSARRLRSRPPI